VLRHSATRLQPPKADHRGRDLPPEGRGGASCSTRMPGACRFGCPKNYRIVGRPVLFVFFRLGRRRRPYVGPPIITNDVLGHRWAGAELDLAPGLGSPTGGQQPSVGMVEALADAHARLECAREPDAQSAIDRLPCRRSRQPPYRAGSRGGTGAEILNGLVSMPPGCRRAARIGESWVDFGAALQGVWIENLTNNGGSATLLMGGFPGNRGPAVRRMTSFGTGLPMSGRSAELDNGSLRSAGGRTIPERLHGLANLHVPNRSHADRTKRGGRTTAFGRWDRARRLNADGWARWRRFFLARGGRLALRRAGGQTFLGPRKTKPALFPRARPHGASDPANRQG